jgi:hypothetical protein
VVGERRAGRRPEGLRTDFVTEPGRSLGREGTELGVFEPLIKLPNGAILWERLRLIAAGGRLARNPNGLSVNHNFLPTG